MIEFTDSQKKSVANAAMLLSAVVMVAFAVLVIWGVVTAFSIASSALIPVLLGFFLALFFKPYFLWWKRMLKNPTLALVVMLVTVLLPLGFLIWYAGAVVIDELSNLIAQAPHLFRSVSLWFQGTFPKLHGFLQQMGLPYDSAGEMFSRYGISAIKAGAGALKCLFGVIVIIVTFVFFIFFLLTKDRRGGEIVAGIPFLKPETKAFVAEQIDVFVDILVSFFQRQVVICLIEGCMYGAGFWLVGLPYGFLVGFVLGVMNLIPLFGSIVCLPIALPLAYFTHGGSLSLLLSVLGVWLAGQVLDGYLITPKIQGDKTGLGYMGVIFAFFFWPTVLGPLLGMLLAIPLSAFCVVLYRALTARYFKPII